MKPSAGDKIATIQLPFRNKLEEEAKRFLKPYSSFIITIHPPPSKH